ncbi:hypothetical protein PR048_021262 [Dryococelus australis]|uniref:Tc1-like transposase DDE domain-containing protein n=1 Tax=Dryococelus australis TaxID=614101 RepID=A0ABQ9GXR1_9NEOP|nr:hypothetical protein PR048_021262 [Dryococelus australis]
MQGRRKREIPEKTRRPAAKFSFDGDVERQGRSQGHMLVEPAVLSPPLTVSSLDDSRRAAVAERLACSHPTKEYRVQSPAGSLRIFACGNRAGAVPLVGGFSRGSRVTPHSPHFTIICSEDRDVTSRPNLLTHSLNDSLTILSTRTFSRLKHTSPFRKQPCLHIDFLPLRYGFEPRRDPSRDFSHGRGELSLCGPRLASQGMPMTACIRRGGGWGWKCRDWVLHPAGVGSSALFQLISCPCAVLLGVEMGGEKIFTHGRCFINTQPQLSACTHAPSRDRYRSIAAAALAGLLQLIMMGALPREYRHIAEIRWVECHIVLCYAAAAHSVEHHEDSHTLENITEGNMKTFLNTQKDVPEVVLIYVTVVEAAELHAPLMSEVNIDYDERLDVSVSSDKRRRTDTLHPSLDEHKAVGAVFWCGVCCRGVEGALHPFGYESIFGDHVNLYMMIVFPQEYGIIQHVAKRLEVSARRWTSTIKTSKFFPVPPNSLDLNPIEDLWDHVDRRVRRLSPPPRTLQKLWDALQIAWLQIPVETYQNLTESLPARLAAVRAAKGGYFGY